MLAQKLVADEMKLSAVVSEMAKNFFFEKKKHNPIQFIHILSCYSLGFLSKRTGSIHSLVGKCYGGPPFDCSCAVGTQRFDSKVNVGIHRKSTF